MSLLWLSAVNLCKVLVAGTANANRTLAWLGFLWLEDTIWQVELVVLSCLSSQSHGDRGTSIRREVESCQEGMTYVLFDILYWEFFMEKKAAEVAKSTFDKTDIILALSADNVPHTG